MPRDNSKYGLLNSDLEKIISIIVSNKNVAKISLFGSRAKGNFENGSDVDLALFGNLTNDDKIEIALSIDELYLPYKFDLVLYNRVKEKALIEHINRVGIELFSR